MMYAQHFGFRKLPFEKVFDAQLFFDKAEHSRIRRRVSESFKAGRGLAVIAGPIGLGKSTLGQMIMSDVREGKKRIWLAEPPENSTELFQFIAQELSVTTLDQGKSFMLRHIRDALLKIHSEGSSCLLVIDEAHLMTDDALDAIRILNNLEENSCQLLQVLLLGQETLMDTLNRPEMENLKQRIATLETLEKMNPLRVREYISHRIQAAGGLPCTFTDTGWAALEKAFISGGTPRIVNSLCDRSLTLAFEREKSVVDIDDVYEAAQGLGLQKEIYFHKLSLRRSEHAAQLPAEEDARLISIQKSLQHGFIHAFGRIKERAFYAQSASVLFILLFIEFFIFFSDVN